MCMKEMEGGRRVRLQDICRGGEDGSIEYLDSTVQTNGECRQDGVGGEG